MPEKAARISAEEAQFRTRTLNATFRVAGRVSTGSLRGWHRARAVV